MSGRIHEQLYRFMNRDLAGQSPAHDSQRVLGWLWPSALSTAATAHRQDTGKGSPPIVERGPALASSLRRQKGFEQTPLRFAQVAATQSCLPPRGILESKPESRVNHFVNSAYFSDRRVPSSKREHRSAMSASFKMVRRAAGVFKILAVAR